MHYFTRHIGDYAKDTGHLSLLEHGVYSVLLDWTYATERELPSENEQIYRICRALTASERKAVDSVVQEFFPAIDGKRINKRACFEIEVFKGKSKLAAESAAKRWKNKGNASEMPSHSVGKATRARVPSSNIQNPETNNQEPSFGNDDLVSEQVADTEILQFATSWPGEISTGTPKMDPDWVTSQVAVLNGRIEWPRNWRRWLVACWRREWRKFREQKKSAPAAIHGEGEAPVPLSAPKITIADLKKFQ